jgi:hypothetical protein
MKSVYCAVRTGSLTYMDITVPAAQSEVRLQTVLQLPVYIVSQVKLTCQCGSSLSVLPTFATNMGLVLWYKGKKMQAGT